MTTTTLTLATTTMVSATHTTTILPPRAQRPLIAGVLRGLRTGPVAKDLCPDRHGATTVSARIANDGFTPAERDAVRRAAGDGRDAGERALDCVVERLVRELTW